MNNLNSRFSLLSLDPTIIQKCIHCGMCLPSCPTYQETKIERNSPRGRISLMRAIAEKRMDLTELFAHELYFCLGCLACQTACPVGVDYKTLFEASRQDIEKSQILNNPLRQIARTALIRFLFRSSFRLRTFGKMLRVYQSIGLDRLVPYLPFIPAKLKDMMAQLPPIASHFSSELIQPRETPFHTKVRWKVGLLTGCVQDLVYSKINRDTVDVLLYNGCEVICPPHQGCCGSLHAHNGELKTAQLLAQKLMDAFPLNELDALITNAAGCGSHLKHFSNLFPPGTPWRKKAEEWDKKVFDIHEWLVKIGFSKPKLTDTSQPQPVVTYHDACHLCHGQKIKNEPRIILNSLPFIRFVELEESDHCCGSAGIYNILQPEMAHKLLNKKIAKIKQTAASILCTANPGCLLFIEKGLKKQQLNIQTVHPISLLAQWYKMANPGEPTPQKNQEKLAIPK
ncbi:(Fe-S)-binding protein [Methylacidiphilum caldifontis]|uniref:(Fe-S)-binding protein n=1 Tax=Methylacidiphilum caldifontis TaxID=2795386 RepID=UPI001A8D4D97|nr:(Fe-S)-binding protein [Methylacidiphilum caldifontis]QSR88559.1 (Fe-S)-binding protein [Methylacidiphilum caldifontis]